MKIALPVAEPDRHERQAPVRGALQVVARQDSQTARVERQRFMDAELRAEISDRLRLAHAGGRGMRWLSTQIVPQPAVHALDPDEKGRIDGELSESGGRGLLEQPPRIST